MYRNKNCEIIKKTLKIGLPIIAVISAIIIAAYIVLQIPLVQTYLAQKLAVKLSEKFGAEITIKGVSFEFFNKLVLEEVLLKDQQKDSLIYIEKLTAAVDSFSIRKRYVGIGRLKMSKTFFNAKNDSSGQPNYQYIIDSFNKPDSLQRDSLNIDIIIKRFDFQTAKLNYSYFDSTGIQNICVNNIDLDVSDIQIHPDQLAFQIENLSLNHYEDFKLEKLSASFKSYNDSLLLNNFKLKTSRSEISEANIFVDLKSFKKSNDLMKLKFLFELQKSEISLTDVSFFVPEIIGMDESIEISGLITGTPADIKGKNIELSLRGNTKLNADIYLSGLPQIENTYMHLDFKKSFVDLRDLSKIKLPNSLPIRNLNFHEYLLQSGVIEYTGNFTGFLSDFVAFGTFRSRWGVLNTDLSFVPADDDRLKINGKLKTVSFKLGNFFKTDKIGRLTFAGNINGLLNRQTNNFSALVAGRIDSIKVYDYLYKNINMNGEIVNKKFDGSLLVNDPNLKFRFDGEFDLNQPTNIFNFEMDLEKANLKALKLVDDYRIANLGFALNANFKGNNIDDIDGLIHFSEGKFENENGNLSFDNFDIKTFYNNESVIQIRSDFCDADIRGQYELNSLVSSVKKILANYLPSAGLNYKSGNSKNIFEFKFNFKDINRFTNVLIPDLQSNPGQITGNINSEKNLISIDADFPFVIYRSATMNNVNIGLKTDSKIFFNNKIEEISIGENFKTYNLSLNSEASGDILDSRATWNNFGMVSYSGSINTSTRFVMKDKFPRAEITVKPTRLYIADTLWQINSSKITIDSSLIKIDNLKISNKAQSVTANGTISKNQNDKLNVLFNLIDLNTINRFIPDLAVKGELNGSFSVFDIYKKALFLSDLTIKDFGIIGEDLGNAKILSRWDRNSEEIDADILVESGRKKILHAFGIYNPAKDSLSFRAGFDSFSLSILQPLMGKSFGNFKGTASGKVHLYGSPAYLKHDGALHATNAGIMLTELQVNYRLNDSIKFSGNTMIFPDIKIFDEFGNSGIFSGTIKHTSFSNMEYDLLLRSNRIMAFNTTPAINEQFYGKTFASGSVRITGFGTDIEISGAAKTERGTEMNISLAYEAEALEYDFLSFVTKGESNTITEVKKPDAKSNLVMRFDVEITPDAKAQLIYNSKVGDVIKSQGSGNMRVLIDNDNNILLYGIYKVEQGDYLFTLQNVINKKFEIQEGGTIEWNGDPYDAILNINAIYKLKASLNELFANMYEDQDLSQRVSVSCLISLTKNLNNPNIKFEIDLPLAEDRIKDVVKQFISSDEDLNRQILSLLVLGKFYTPEYLRGTFTAQNNNPLGTTASELLSNQLSNWLSQLSSDFDIGINYRPGNEISNDEIEFALSKQLFNDRVLINGNIGNNAAQKTGTNSSGIVGDADINVKLTRNGKLQLKAYNRANNNIYDQSPYTQGVGVSYREDFNDFNELWRKVKELF